MKQVSIQFWYTHNPTKNLEQMSWSLWSGTSCVSTLINCSQNIGSPIMDASMEPIAEEMHAGVYLAACVCIADHNRQQLYYRAILAAVTIQVTQNQMLIQVHWDFMSTKTIRIQTGSPEWQPLICTQLLSSVVGWSWSLLQLSDINDPNFTC